MVNKLTKKLKKPEKEKQEIIKVPNRFKQAEMIENI